MSQILCCDWLPWRAARMGPSQMLVVFAKTGSLCHIIREARWPNQFVGALRCVLVQDTLLS